MNAATPDQPHLPSRAASPQGARLTAGVVIIGNEVLSAKVHDANTPTILAKFSAAGIRVLEVAVLPDVVERIAEVIRAFSARFDLVVTTGGVGPTHDDCTWKAVALALNRPLVLHLPLIARIEARAGQPLSPEQKRLALLPEGTEMLGADGRWPTLRLENIYVLPGVPSLVVGRVDHICALFCRPPAHLATVDFACDEWNALCQIDAVVASYADLEIGSYPIYGDRAHRLRLTFEGEDLSRVQSAVHSVSQSIGVTRLIAVVWRKSEQDQDQ